jgi:predicted RNase H-like nuclease (RuvC/YqgF family)
VAELTPTSEEVASLRIREANVHRHADEAKEKFVTLAERARLDATKTKQIRKERDELLQTVARLQRECADSYRWINNLLGEVEKERESKIEAENMSTGVAVQVGP